MCWPDSSGDSPSSSHGEASSVLLTAPALLQVAALARPCRWRARSVTSITLLSWLALRRRTASPLVVLPPRRASAMTTMLCLERGGMSNAAVWHGSASRGSIAATADDARAFAQAGTRSRQTAAAASAWVAMVSPAIGVLRPRDHCAREVWLGDAAGTPDLGAAAPRSCRRKRVSLSRGLIPALAGTTPLTASPGW